MDQYKLLIGHVICDVCGHKFHEYRFVQFACDDQCLKFCKTCPMGAYQTQPKSSYELNINNVRGNELLLQAIELKDFDFEEVERALKSNIPVTIWKRID